MPKCVSELATTDVDAAATRQAGRIFWILLVIWIFWFTGFYWISGFYLFSGF